jgi:G3E family GTPase
MANVKLILVGGFLGAGKTTLLSRAAERLGRRGLRVGLITNDQAANLVDTEVLRQGGGDVKEVSGACFCCAFNKLLYVCENLVNLSHPDVIIAEPVGSCTDLSATVLQPIKKYCADRFDLAPYSVLVDPDKLQESLHAGETADLAGAVRYIYRKQIEEADLIVLNKVDALPDVRLAAIRAAIEKESPGTPVVAMSALKGAGVEEWLDHVLSGGPAGQRVVEVDYDTYADGEAALGWLNAAVELTAATQTDWNDFAGKLLRMAQAEIKSQKGDIAHLKVLVTAEGGHIQGNVVGNSAPPATQGSISKPSRHATVIVNARVRISKELLRKVIEDSLRAAAGESATVNIAELTSFYPGRPRPVHRFGQVVK